MGAVVAMTVYGDPAPQGSKTAFRQLRKNGSLGRMAVRESSGRVQPWREDVKQAGLAAMAGRGRPLDGPLEAVMVFTLPRPRGHYGTGRNAGALRPSAPRYPAGYPDLSKLLRSTEDALQSAGVIADDSRLVSYLHAAKVFPGTAPPSPWPFAAYALDLPGAFIAVRALGLP